MTLFFVVVGAAAVAAWLCTRRPSIPYPTHCHDVAITCSARAAPPVPIPRIIWSYWHEDELPLIVEKCRANWQALNPDYEIRMLHSGSAARFIDPREFPLEFPSLPEFRKADWLRLALLRRYGGVWLDASLFLTRSLDWIAEMQRATGADYVGFYIGKFTSDRQRPVLENWFMAAPASNEFLDNLYREFMQILAKGERQYLEDLSQVGDYALSVQKIDVPEYLIMHVAASRLMSCQKYDLCLLKAEESAFFHIHALGWRNTPLYLNLAIFRASANLPALVKLRGSERNFFERRLRLGLYSRNSIVGRYLMKSSFRN